MTHEVHIKGEEKTYAMLRHVAEHLMNLSERVKEGRTLNLQAAAVFYAFTFEAYLNHIGEEDIPFWTEIERVSYKGKMAVLGDHLKMSFDFGTDPFQCIGELFRLRNLLAHGKSGTIDIKQTSDVSVLDQRGSLWKLKEWETLDLAKVGRYRESVRTAIETINRARPHPDSDLWSLGTRSCSQDTSPPKH